MTFLIIYWIVTTIYGVYWCITNPSRGDDKEYFTVMDVFAYIFPAALVSWIAVPMFILASIKFKRKKYE